MTVLAKGSVTHPDALTPYIADEMRVVGELKAEGVITSVYRRAAGPGVYLILEGPSIDAVRQRVDTLPFVEGLMTIDYDEIYEI
jgi:muconolactone delta-isomerase